MRTKTRSDRRGVAAVEFALWMPVMLLMFAGVVDLSLYVSDMHVVARAARDGARVTASTTLANVSDPDDIGAVEDDLEAACVSHALNVIIDSGKSTTGVTVNCNWFTDNSATTAAWFARPEVISAQVSMPYRSVFNLVPALSAQPMRQTFVMVTQVQDDGTIP